MRISLASEQSGIPVSASSGFTVVSDEDLKIYGIGTRSEAPVSYINDLSNTSDRLDLEGNPITPENIMSLAMDTEEPFTSEFIPNNEEYEWEVPEETVGLSESQLSLGESQITSNLYAHTMGLHCNTILSTVRDLQLNLPQELQESSDTYIQSILNNETSFIKEYEDKIFETIGEMSDLTGVSSALLLPDASRILRSSISSFIELTGNSYSDKSYYEIMKDLYAKQYADSLGGMLTEVEAKAVDFESWYSAKRDEIALKLAENQVSTGLMTEELARTETAKELTRSIRFENGKLRIASIGEMTKSLADHFISQENLFTYLLNKALIGIKTSQDLSKFRDTLKTIIRCLEIWEILDRVDLKSTWRDLDASFNTLVQKKLSNFLQSQLDYAVQSIADSIYNSVTNTFDDILEQTAGMEFLVQPLIEEFWNSFKDIRRKLTGICNEIHASYSQTVPIQKKSLSFAKRHSKVICYIQFLKMMLSAVNSIGNIKDMEVAVVRIKAAWDYMLKSKGN